MERIKSEIKNLIDEWRWHCSAEAKYRCEAYGELLNFINSLQEESASEDLDEAANNYVGHAPEIDEDLSCFTKRNAFIKGAQWQKQQDQSTIELAEDHAYLAGQEKMIDKACEWLNSYRQDTPDGTGYISGIINDKTIEDFKKAMEE